MNNINIITSPDVIFSDTLTILAVHPSIALKEELQKQLANYAGGCNVYMFEHSSPSPADIDWLLTVFKTSNITLIDLDNSSSSVRNLASYMIAKPKTFWLTNTQETVYTHISRNRIYNLDFMSNLGGYFETEQ